jgi:hypothetical protein
MGKPSDPPNKDIIKEQLVLLVEDIIDEGDNLCKEYTIIHSCLRSHINRNILQNIMKVKLLQSNDLKKIYKKLSNRNYVNKEPGNSGKIKLSEMFVKESNYLELLNYVYNDINDFSIKLDFIKIMSDENLIICRLLYLQSLLGVNWQTNNK